MYYTEYMNNTTTKTADELVVGDQLVMADGFLLRINDVEKGPKSKTMIVRCDRGTSPLPAATMRLSKARKVRVFVPVAE